MGLLNRIRPRRIWEILDIVNFKKVPKFENFREFSVEKGRLDF